MRTLQIVVATLAFAAVAPGQQSHHQVQRWDTCTITLRGDTHANPFRDVALKATFSHESGRSVPVDGFFDGDATWRIRFMPPETGQWSYRTVSKDPKLDGQRGSIQCIEPEASFLHGPVGADGHHFVHADGTRSFLISTRLSCLDTNDGDLEATIEFLRESRINRVLFMMPGVRGETHRLFGEGNDFWRYNVERFQQIDRFIDALRRGGILASPYFYYFNDRLQRELTPEQDEQYVRYGMARFGAYANVMPVLSNEVESRFSERSDKSYDLRSHEWANRIGKVLKDAAVFGVPVSVHNPQENQTAQNPGFFTLLQQWPFPWADFILKQMQVGALGAAEHIGESSSEPTYGSFTPRAYARHNELLIELRKHGVPVINEEPGYEMDGTRSWNSQFRRSVRATFWTAAMAGAYTMWGPPATYVTGDPVRFLESSQVPNDLKVLARVMDRVPYWEMEPANELVNANAVAVGDAEYRRNYLLAKRGEWYLVYAQDPGRIAVRAEPGEYEVDAIRTTDVPPANKVAFPPNRISADASGLNIVVGSGQDWVIVLKRVS